MAKKCAFLGNDYSISPDGTSEKITAEIRTLIKTEGVDTFFVGSKGGYELDAYKTVVKLKQEEFPNIQIVFVIANTPELQRIKLPFDDFVYPPKAEAENKRWCIVHRNNWIVDNTDFVIAYNRYHGRAFKFCESADRKGVKVIELAKDILKFINFNF